MTIQKIQSVLRHLANGTLAERIRSHVHDWNARRRRRLWDSRAGTGSSLFTYAGGCRLRLHHDSALGREIFARDYEQAECGFIRRFLRTGDVFVDVGANIGFFTILAGRVVGATGSVHAFEPAPATVARLRDNVELNRLTNVQINPFGLSDRTETLSLHLAGDGHDAWNSFGRPTAGQSTRALPIDCEPWDDYAARNGLASKVTLMKIDAEGWEERVIRGAAASLGRTDAPVLMIEFAEASARNAGGSCRQLYDAVLSLGYALYGYSPAAGCLLPRPPGSTYAYVNLVACKDADAVGRRLRKR